MMTMKNLAVVSMMSLLMSMTGAVDAARVNANKKGGMHTISGMVVHKNKAVSGAHVHVKHKHKARASAATTTAKAQTAKPKAARAHAHAGTMTGSNGAFSMRHHHSGVITLEAHKKGVGKGHATVAAGTNINSVVIRLHKLHHHHA